VGHTLPSAARANVNLRCLHTLLTCGGGGVYTRATSGPSLIHADFARVGELRRGDGGRMAGAMAGDRRTEEEWDGDRGGGARGAQYPRDALC
jgi:hypothetical protein